MIFLIVIAFVVVVLGVILFVFAHLSRKQTLLPGGKILYSDTADHPGEVFISKTLPLVGKPDYIFKKGKELIPVEVKRGRTPMNSPYANHIAQLFAYCYLVTEKYGQRPKFGKIVYPNEEFTVEYSEGVEDGLKLTVTQILERKRTDMLRTGMKKVCKNCRLNHREH